MNQLIPMPLRSPRSCRKSLRRRRCPIRRNSEISGLHPRDSPWATRKKVHSRTIPMVLSVNELCHGTPGETTRSPMTSPFPRTDWSQRLAGFQSMGRCGWPRVVPRRKCRGGSACPPRCGAAGEASGLRPDHEMIARAVPAGFVTRGTTGGELVGGAADVFEFLEGKHGGSLDFRFLISDF